MTTTATQADTVAQHQLERFEGLPVLNAAAQITRAGDGLSQSLKTDPEALELGQEVIVILRTEVAKVQYVPVDRENLSTGVTRVHTLATQTCTIAGDLLVDQLDDLLNAQATRNRIRREKEQGVQHLFEGDDDAEGQGGED